MKISQSAIDLIVREEVSSKAYYERHYTHPEWPGGASGVTVGIGYDLGYASAAKINADWIGKVDGDTLQGMVECAGVKGDAAKSLSAQMHNRITVSWDAAMAVFMGRDIPQWIAATVRALPNCDLLSATCLGVIVSLNYNRGMAGYTASGDRYTEMHAIKQAMVTKRFEAIPALLDSMARLWPGSGVSGRRHREADLFRAGLQQPAQGNSPTAEPSPDVIDSSRPDAPARTKPPATSKTQNGTTGAVVIGGTIAAQQAHAHGLISPELAIFAGFLAVLGGITAWVLWYRNRNPL
jgi:hypothetical protein